MKKETFMYANKNKNIAKREIEKGYITYRTLADAVGDMILCNNMASRTGHMEIENGCDYNEENDEYEEIFQYYIITNNGAEELKRMTDEIVYYDTELDLYIWGITHCGTSWDYVFTDIKVK